MTLTVKVVGIDGKELEKTNLPIVFNTPYLPDVIHKVYVNMLSHSFQKQGRYPSAGQDVSAESRNTGLGIARIARARGEGFPRAGQAAGVAGVRHGRVAHPPQSWKKIYKKINKKEKTLGLASAIASTGNKDLIIGRGHKIADINEFPIVVSNEIEQVKKTKDLKNILIKLGLTEELGRTQKNKSATSVLIVASENKDLLKLNNSIPGVSIVNSKSLSVLDLVPGSKPIRLTIFSKNSLDELKNMNCSYTKILEMKNNE